MMKGCQGADAFFPECLQAFAHNIPVRSVVHAVYRIHFAVPEGKIVAVFADRARVPGPGPFCQSRPLCRVKPLPGHAGIEIFVAKVMQASIGLLMMFILFQSPAVHITGIPLILICGHTVRPPVEKQPEFGIPEPCGNFFVHLTPVNLTHKYPFSPFQIQKFCPLSPSPASRLLPLCPRGSR